MYTSYIGKKFLKLYNERKESNLTPKEFFVDIQFPIFFDDDRHLMHVHGSTFFQKVSTKETSEKRESIIRLNRLMDDVNNRKLSASTYVGFAAEGAEGVTSGQVSSLNREINDDELYSSWIGAGLAIGLKDRFSVLIDNDNILWSIYEGWSYYRQFLNQTPNVKDKEIDFWNTIWLLNKISGDYNEKNPMDSLIIETESSLGQTRIKKKNWSEMVFFLTKYLPGQKVITVSAFKFDKTNTSLGFINIFLSEIHEMYELRDQLFIDESTSILEDRQIQELETFYNFRSACQQGTIGLKALEPAKLRDYMPRGSILWAKGQEFKFKDEESYFNYQLYKLWIMAVLNKKELLELASNTALTLTKLEAKDERGKKVLSTLSSEVRESKNLRYFIENLSKVILEIPNEADALKQTVEEVLKMPADNFPLFITLIRFEYNYQISKNK